MYKKILLLGYKSYVATGLVEKFQNSEFQATGFSRGKELKNDNIITGNVFDLASNSCVEDNYDTVINFILLKNESVEENIRYLKSLIDFCNLKNIKRLIHISSISVYPNNEKYINETSNIDVASVGKGGYSSLKIETDKYLLSQKLPFELCLVRPGFVVSNDIKSPLSGIAIKLPLPNCCLLLGNKQTTLPLIDREVLQTALINITRKDRINDVYLLLKNDKGTKYKYVKDFFKLRMIVLNRPLILFIALILKSIKILSFSKYQKIKSLFKNIYFDSSVSENDLQMKF